MRSARAAVWCTVMCVSLCWFVDSVHTPITDARDGLLRKVQEPIISGLSVTFSVRSRLTDIHSKRIIRSNLHGDLASHYELLLHI